MTVPASLLRQTAPGQMSSRVAFVGQCGQPMPIRFQMPQAAQVPVQAIEATAITGECQVFGVTKVFAASFKTTDA